MNDGWVGDACTGASDCTIDGAFCRQESAGFPGGMCSLECDGKFCADTDAPNTTATFCAVSGAPSGPVCVSRCSFTGFQMTGCRPGYTCSTVERYTDASAVQDVCVPAADQKPQVSECRMSFARAGNTYTAWKPSGNVAPGTSPPKTCDIVDPISINSPVEGLPLLYDQTQDLPLRMRCELASAIMKMMAIAKALNIAEIHHIGTYNCRVIAGTTTISQHGYGRAIDIGGVKMKTGEVYTVLDHWEKGVAAPKTAAGKVLYDLAHALHDQRVFNIILTPEFNAAHANHLHVDLTPNSNTIHDEPVYVLGEFDGVE